MSIKFVDQPPGNNAGPTGKWKAIVDELKSKPEKWALVETYPREGSARSSADYLKKKFPGIQAVSRKNELYARWMGEKP